MRRTLFDVEHEDCRRSVATFLTKEVLPHYEAWSEGGRVPRELFTALGELGALGLGVAEEFGGSGISDFRYNCILIEEAQALGVMPAVLGANLQADVVLPYLTDLTTPEQRRRWLPGVVTGETITAIEASTGKVLSTHKVSNKTSPSREAPVEILFVPGANPPVAYITNMFGGTLWTATWNAQKKDFDVAQVYDFGTVKSGVPLEIYFNTKADRLYVTTAKPGHLHIFDISKSAGKPELINSIPTAEGAHHVAFTKDEKLGYVQNSLLNLPGMSDGSITIVDLVRGETIGSIDTLKEQGFNPNSIVLLPQWNHPAGH